MEHLYESGVPLAGAALMRSIRTFAVPEDGLAIWFLGQNGFVLKAPDGFVCAIDPYLTDSCRTKFPDSPFDLGRKLPVFLEPEELDVDLYAVTHSHEDHLEEETIRRLRCRPTFAAPWEAHRRLLSFGVEPEACNLLHPHQALRFNSASLQGTFAIPTDNTDLNHMGLLFEFANGTRFYNTGDTAYAEGLARLLPRDVDLCAICINGRFGNLSSSEAANVVAAVQPHVAIPTHYDMLNCNLSDPEQFRSAVAESSNETQVTIIEYGRPLLYRRSS